MGCLCSKEAVADGDVSEILKAAQLGKSPVELVAPTKVDDIRLGISLINDVPLGRQPSKLSSQGAREKPAPGHHQRGATLDLAFTDRQRGFMSRIVSLPHGAEGEENIAGWPTWLASVAGEAIRGLVPRRAEAFKKLKQIGQGTYSSVYKAQDLETGKVVAMKKVRFANMDPESVRFMAREIHILRSLDHPNVMKLEGVVTSRISGSLYLVFEYMEHDLAGILARSGNRLTEPQIKCYMQQLFRGLDHCHNRGVLHRDIKGSNLLISDDGVLKIGDFGLATFFHPDQKQPLTTRVVTLWYRAPELLLGATQYGVGVDLWSTGCILAELFAGEPIMPGRTEVEQLHKIFKLCGSLPGDYWLNNRFPNATTYRSQVQYKRRLAEKFTNLPPVAVALIEKLLLFEPKERGTAASALGSEFFSMKPLPCDPSRMPKYPPSKEFDAKRDAEARRKWAGLVAGQVPEYPRRESREAEPVSTPEFNEKAEASLQDQSNTKSISRQYAGTGLFLEPPPVNVQKGYSHCRSTVHLSSAQSAWMTMGPSSKKNSELRTLDSFMCPSTIDVHSQFRRAESRASSREPVQVYVPRKNRMQYSGPLVSPGGNLEGMLKEHERQIQQAVRTFREKRDKS
ncbi:hypothetical protein MLD38_001145 [Melastoma candidum]|uniref:Uncharacterized protein n=1 Tax=Melastoma candidum TaxID=119954 RepID=A0ACB9SKX1_9MYRT|nr:hypothetical protein MLD38_001145 [Melastoma candidum]